VVRGGALLVEASEEQMERVLDEAMLEQDGEEDRTEAHDSGEESMSVDGSSNSSGNIYAASVACQL
jgi:hypothetical protein